VNLHVEPLTGDALQRALPELARLRISVFRDWPYLYDGTFGYEQGYLAKFAASDGAVIVAAFDAGEIVGAATGSPMMDHADEFAKPFKASGYDIERVFYFGESVLLKGYRGKGIGHAFFDHRESHARRLGYRQTAFCGVVRPADHPLKPKDYVPLDDFWTKRGYKPIDGLVGFFEWKDLDQAEPTKKPMQFWMKAPA
jgi:GNAT superfamily N-acetyltransferase